MSVRAQERLMMFHSHIRTKDESEFVDSFPFMSTKQRSNYDTQFQCHIKIADEFPLNGSLPERFSPWVWRGRDLVFPGTKASNVQETETIDDDVALIEELVDQHISIIDLRDNKMDTEDIDNMEESSHVILLIDDVTDQVTEFLKTKNHQVSVITSQAIDFNLDVKMIIFEQYLITSLELESEKVNEIKDIKSDDFCNKYEISSDKRVYEII